MSKKGQIVRNKPQSSPAKPRSTCTSSATARPTAIGTMKDLLGGKGSGLAEMTNAGLPVPPGFTISTDVCTIYYKEKAKIPAGDRPRDRRERQEARKGGRRDARVDRQSAARVGPLGREVLDARHDGHDPEPRPERRGGRGAEEPDTERPLRVRQLSPLHPDVRQRRARDPEGCVRARVRGGQEGARARSSTPSSTRARCAKSSSATRTSCRSGPAARFRRIRRAAEDGARRGVPLVDESARAGIPPHLRHPRSHRHRRQRPDDGVRQHRRSIGHRRRLHAKPGDRQERVLRRVPDQRAGRGCRRRHPDAAADSRARAGDAEGLQAAARHHDPAREALQGHPGLRVHDSGRAAVHAADPQRQTHRLRGGRDRDRPGGRKADHAEGSRAAGRSRSRSISCWRPGSIRPNGRRFRWRPKGCRRRRARPAARSSFRPTTPWSGRSRASRSSSCGARRCPTTSTACSWRRAS